jgi:hypothetical protein
VFYRDDSQSPTYEQAVIQRQQALSARAVSRDRILDGFIPR